MRRRSRKTGAMRATGVHHVSLMTPVVDETVTFYVDVLGLTPRSDRPDFGIGGAWLDAGGQQVHLIQGEAPANVGQPFALAVDALDAVITELRARGVEVSDAMAIGPRRQAFTQDPAGNVVELNQSSV